MYLIFFICCLLNLALNANGEVQFNTEELLSDADSSGESIGEHLLERYEDILRLKVTSNVLGDALQYTKGFKDAKPFPHFTAVDIFPKEVLRAATREIQDSPLSRDGCTDGNICHNDGAHEKLHMVFSDVGSFGPATDALHKFMDSPEFLKYLQLATGIDGLVIGSADSDAGVHQILSQGFEKVHTDFNKDKKRALHRRVSVYLYLNTQWKASYGGHLELWSRDLQHCAAHIVPDFGRLVVFGSTDFSYHGHQSPLVCPPNRSNTMLAMHYYTPGRPSHECFNDNCFKDHHERYRVTRCPSCSDVCMNSTAE